MAASENLAGAAAAGRVPRSADLLSGRHAVASIAGIFASVMGIAVLCGWMLDVPALEMDIPECCDRYSADRRRHAVGTRYESKFRHRPADCDGSWPTGFDDG